MTTQRNAQIHVSVSLVVVALAALLRVTRIEWVLLVLVMGVVISAEMVNTALESVLDSMVDGFHPLVKVAKDVAAGAVLVTAITAVAIGLIIFVPPLAGLVFR